MVKVGLLVLAEGRTREDVYQSRYEAKVRETVRIKDFLSDRVCLVETDTEDIRDKYDLFRALTKFKSEGVEGCLIFVSVYISAALAAMAVRLSDVPCAIMGNSASDSFARGGYLAAIGAVEQMGLPCKRIPGDIADERAKNTLMDFFQACHVKKSLEGMTYGMFGGRSLGINTATADPAQWLKQFGVDIEQIDQIQIVNEAEKIPQDDVERYMEWARQKYGLLQYTEGKFQKEHLEKMVRSYLAVKKLAKKYNLDLMGIKCQPELSNGYALQCMTIQLLNDPYDADGQKDTMVCSCEADCDGALTMEILKLLSNGKPTALQDICYYDHEKAVLANCGSSASWFAAHSEVAEENLKEVHLIPHSFGEAGGAATQFTFAPGVYTYARLYRSGGIYKLAAGKLTAQKMEREELHNYSWSRPTAIVTGVDEAAFSKIYSCNHIHCVAGDYMAPLAEFCRLMGIELQRIDKEQKV